MCQFSFFFRRKNREREWRENLERRRRERKFIVSVRHKRSRFSLVNFAFLSVLDVVDLHSPVPPLTESLCPDFFESFRRKRRHGPGTEFFFDNFLYFREHFPLVVGVCVCEAVVDVHMCEFFGILHVHGSFFTFSQFSFIFPSDNNRNFIKITIEEFHSLSRNRSFTRHPLSLGESNHKTIILGELSTLSGFSYSAKSAPVDWLPYHNSLNQQNLMAE